MDSRFTAQMSAKRTPAINSTLTLIQVVALQDIAFLQPFVSLAGEDPTDPQFFVHILRDVDEWTAATAVTPQPHDTSESDANTLLAAAMRVWETSATPAAEPSKTNAKTLHSWFVHPQGGWQDAWSYPLRKGETLTIVLDVPATSQSVHAGFRGRVA